MAGGAALVSESRKRQTASYTSSTDSVHLHDSLHRSNKRRSVPHTCKVCVPVLSSNLSDTRRGVNLDQDHASSCVAFFESSTCRCVTDHGDTGDTLTESSCCSSLPDGLTPFEQQTTHSMIPDSEAQSFCGNDGDLEIDISCFLYGAWDHRDNEALSFDPETVFLNDAAFTESHADTIPFIDFSGEDGSWFFSDFDGQGHAIWNEILDQEWMAVSAANLDELNDAIGADYCVMHLLETEECGRNL
ncbi:hypothetical protein KP509_11G046600 [Ceratopteris richardii]|uniref:Uncharacterized protein n=1 Tax=Ceratopteris richardii TaxID=49495 RepID=A0A8T2TV40_CERRI|nr:hypothetical protein KP509_11G046600 [Ceratopteris richardii]